MTSNNGRKFRVVVKSHNGRRYSKIVETITLARKLEGKLKTQAIEKNLLGIKQIPLIDDVWLKFLTWAKENKKSWKQDVFRWECHIKPHLKKMPMDIIKPYHIQIAIDDMKTKRDYAPATIRQVVALIKRIYNWSIQMGLYDGDNPASKIKLPKLNNEVTECLTKEQISRLLNTLKLWNNQRVALLVKFALFTGFRRGEIFALKWENVDCRTLR